MYHIGPQNSPGNDDGGSGDDGGQSTAALVGEIIGGILPILIMICCISWYCYLWCSSS